MVLGGAGVVTYASANEPAASDAKSRHRRAAIHTLKLADEGRGRKGLNRRTTQRFSAVLLTWDDADRQAEGTPQVRTRDAETGAWSGWRTVEAEPSQADGTEGERAALRGGTESVWTGDSDGVEVRLVNADGTEATGQPAGMDVKLLDPGSEPEGAPVTALEPAAFTARTTAQTRAQSTAQSAAQSAAPTATEAAGSTGVTDAGTETAAEAAPASGTVSPGASGASGASDAPPAAQQAAPDADGPDGSADAAADEAEPEPTPTVPAPRPSTVAKPPIITQAEWGASTDYDGTPSYSDGIKAAVVHHTGVDSDNQVSCAESRARMRTIQQEHFSRGYYDIGYNFVVDRCGQIFEGRSGGMDLPVVGAHDAGFNTDTLGISYIGNYETARPSRAAMDAIARVIAWKFGMYGIDPAGRVTLTSRAPKGYSGNKYEEGRQVEMPRVLGHRDTNATACPGAHLYGKLGLIRTLAGLPGVSHALATSDYNGDGVGDLVAGTPKGERVVIVPGSVEGPVKSARRVITQNSKGVLNKTESGDGFGWSTAWGDVNGDGYADLAIGAPGEDDTYGHPNRGLVTLLYGPGLTTGWAYTTSGVKETGAGLGAAVAVGDFNGDGLADVFAGGQGNGGSYRVRLTGKGLTSGTITGSSGSLSYLDAATGDFNRDGYTDLALNYRDASGTGRVMRFAGSANGLTKAGVLSVRGGRSIAAGDVDGDGYDDIVIGQAVAKESGGAQGGQVTMLFGTSSGFTTKGMKVLHQDSAGVPGTDEYLDGFGASVSLGDYDADGYTDALVGSPYEDINRSGVRRGNAGAVTLLRGTSSGLTGSGGKFISQDTSGIPGGTEKDDQFGWSVSLSDLSGYGRADLTIGAKGENTWDGLLTYVPSNSTGIGLSQAVIYSKTYLGTPTDGQLGWTLAP